MHRFLLAAWLLLISFSTLANAQDDVQSIFSHECYQAAKTKAMDTISSPQLTAVGTFPITNAPIVGSSSFSWQTAKANMWLYTFRSSLTNSPIAILTYKSKLSGECVALEIASDSSGVAHTLVSESSIRSDSLVAELQRNNTFLSLYIQHKELAADSVFLVNADELKNDIFPPGANIWLIGFKFNKGKMLCVYDISNHSKSVCDAAIDGVDDDPNVSGIALVGPSPAESFATVRLPDNQISGLRELKVYDSRGVACFSDQNLASALMANTLVLPVQNLASGSYYIHVVAKDRSYTVPLIVRH